MLAGAPRFLGLVTPLGGVLLIGALVHLRRHDAAAMTLGRIFAGIVAALLFAGAVVMGAVIAALLLGVAVVFAATFMARVWWLRRKLRNQPQAAPAQSPFRDERPAIDAEFSVVDTDAEARPSQRLR